MRFLAWLLLHSYIEKAVKYNEAIYVRAIKNITPSLSIHFWSMPIYIWLLGCCSIWTTTKRPARAASQAMFLLLSLMLRTGAHFDLFQLFVGIVPNIFLPFHPIFPWFKYVCKVWLLLCNLRRVSTHASACNIVSMERIIWIRLICNTYSQTIHIPKGSLIFLNL